LLKRYLKRDSAILSIYFFFLTSYYWWLSTSASCSRGVFIDSKYWSISYSFFF